MPMRRMIEFFESYEKFREFKESLSDNLALPVDSREVGDRALELAEEHEPRSDRSELKRAISEFNVAFDPNSFGQVRAMLQFMGDNFFKDISHPPSPAIIDKIASFQGPKFFFVGHSSYFDYILTARLIERAGLTEPIMHFSGTITRELAGSSAQGIPCAHVAEEFFPSSA